MKDEARDVRAEAYVTSLEHLLDEFARIDVMIRGCVALARDAARDQDPYRGLYISDADVETLLTQSTDTPVWSPSRSQDFHDKLRAMAEHSAARLAISGGAPELRLRSLREMFALTDRDRDLLLLALAPEISNKPEFFFAYLQDDLTKRRLSVNLALDILAAGFEEKLALRERLIDSAPLVRHGLLEVFEEPQSSRPSFLGRSLRIDPRVANYLMGGDAIDAEISSCVELAAVSEGATPVFDYGARRAFLQRALALLRSRGRLKLHLHGVDGRTRANWARALSRLAGAPFLSIDLIALAAGDEPIRRFERAVREARLRGAAMFVDDLDALPTSGPARALLLAMETRTEGLALSIFSSAQGRLGQRGGADERISVLVEPPSSGERERIWAEALSASADEGAKAEIPALASKFAFDAERIFLAAAAARARSGWRDETAPMRASDVNAACRDQAAADLGGLARIVRSGKTWDDLVLPEDTKRQLREIGARVRHRRQVFESWGFRRHTEEGRGLSALFSGPSGVGKTMAAEVVAAELSLDLYRIDLSSVVDKYIGETEKNLARIFAAAEGSGAILFFDEADALFGKRSEVQDARDRYANLETSYLLQRMETYSGVSILASNLRRNMDDAFTRRLAFIVQFPSPEAPERLAIWQRAFPSAAPLADDVDLEGIAEQWRLTGASIKSIALSAAFFAAAEKTPISMSHLVAATRREWLKFGRSAAKSDFGKYAAWL